MSKGALYIVATPIGNLSDITHRAIEVLRQVDYIAAEDTRHSKILLSHYQISTPMLALHEHNETQQYKKIIELLAQGKTVALISDAGTPLISDPGYRLVHEVAEQGFSVVPIPGACAGIAALSVSGLPTDRFVFEGFLPAKAGTKTRVLEQLIHEERTMIFYEAPHRVLASLKTLMTVFGGARKIVVARELTKKFETIYRDTLENMIDYFVQHEGEIKGELVLLVAGCERAAEQELNGKDHALLKTLLDAVSTKQASQLASEITGKKKNLFYQYALQIKGEGDD